MYDPLGTDYELLYKNPTRTSNIEQLKQTDAAHMSFPESLKLSGDVFINVIHIGQKGYNKLLCRFGIHTSFLTMREESSNQLQCSMDTYLVDPKAVRKLPSYDKF